MKHILEQLWYGKVYPQEQHIPKNREFLALDAEIFRCHGQLYNSIAPEQQDLWEKYEDLVQKQQGYIEKEQFAYAFRLGGQMMLATLTAAEN